MDKITQLGKSQEFKSAISHAKNWSKSHNYDLGDQNLKQSVQSFGDHYEESHQHQKNASVAYETSQNLSKQIDYVRANSQRIDTVENQKFAEWAADQLGGYDQLEEVARKDVGRLHAMGVQYLETHYGGRPSLPTNEADLKSQYDKDAKDIEQQNQIQPNTKRVEAMSAQNHVSQNRVIDNSPQIQAIQNEEAVSAKLGWDEHERKKAMKIEERRFKNTEKEHRENNLGYMQQGAAKEMQQRHVKNAN